MKKNSYYSQENHGPYELFDLGDFALEDGGIIRNCQIAYATFGTLNADKDNAILITTWYSGTSKIIEQVFTGKGRAIDPDKYFIIIVNQIGNGLSTSPHNTTPPLQGADFPRVRIEDDVRAQHKLVTELFGITSLALVTGGSMGAQQTWEWAVRYPDMVQRAAPIAGRAKTTPHNFLFVETLRYALTSDLSKLHAEKVTDHDAEQGLRHHGDLWSVMGYSIEFFNQELYKNLGFASPEHFRTGFTQNYFLPMDPDNLLCMAWKWQQGDVSRRTNGDLSAALKRIKAKVFVIAIDGDMLFPPSDCQADHSLAPDSEFKIIHSHAGHLGLFGLEASFMEQLDDYLGKLLAESKTKARAKNGLTEAKLV